MAFSIVDLAGTTGQSNFTFSFPYLSQSHIHVFISGIETFAFSFNSTFVIHLTVPLAADATVRIQRLTPINAPLVDFSNGSVLGETDLDTSKLQILYDIQEVSDVFTTKLGLDNTGLVWDALSHRIKNGEVATGSNDFVIKSQLDAVSAGGPGSHNIGAHADSITTSLVKGDILIVKDQGGSVLKYDKLAAGANGQVAVPDSAATSGLRYVYSGAGGTVGGTVDAITLAPVPAITAYAQDQEFWFIASGPNTGATTVAVSGLSVKSVTKEGTTALSAGDIPTSGLVGVRYDGTRFQLLTSTVLTNKTGSLASSIVGATQATGDSTTKLSTTAFTQQEIVDKATNNYPRIPVRQTVLTGSVDTNGQSNWLVSGTGLQIDYNATTTPVVLAHANGFDTTGGVDALTRLTSNQTNQFGALPANIVSFIQADRSSSSAISGSNTRIPPQYGEIFDQTQAALLHFDGTDAATTTTDDYGNTWTFVANAQLDTAQKQFGSASLLLDGTGDYAEWVPSLPARFAHQGYGWTMECWVRFNVLPTTTQHMTIINAGQSATTFGVLLSLFNNAGTTKLELSLSSNGTSADIVSLGVGTNTTWATGTWYHFAVVFDPIQGKYYLYRDGAQDLSVTSAVPICQIIKVRLGEQLDAAAVQHNGWIDEFRISNCVRYPNGTTFTPSASAFSVEGLFFSIPEMKMIEVTSASSSAGINPGFTNRPTRLIVGEAEAGAASITTTRSYAYQGRYNSPDTAIPGAGTRTSFQTNLGFIPKTTNIPLLRNYTADLNYTPGMITIPSNGHGTYVAAVGMSFESRVLASWVTGATGTSTVENRTTGANAGITNTSWKMFTNIKREW